MADTLRSFAEVSLLPVTTPGGERRAEGRLSFAGWESGVYNTLPFFFLYLFYLFYLMMTAIGWVVS